MQVGMVGLGRMGMNMTRRLIGGNHKVVVSNRTNEKVKKMEAEGAIGSESLDELVRKIKPPRVVWIMLPAGQITEEHISMLSHRLNAGDLIVDGGNTYYKDDMRRAQQLSSLGIHYLDVGVSGGLGGLKQGYCLMAGGGEADFKYVEPLLCTLAAPDGYAHCGPTGAGHFAKMVHNGIEYAIMEAYGEGFEILKASPYSQRCDLAKVAHLWNQGSIIRSWLLELLEKALKKDPHLETIRGYVEDSGEGRWTVMQAVESGVAATTIAHALFKRFQSREQNLFSDKIIAALRQEFGGHAVKGRKSGG